MKKFVLIFLCASLSAGGLFAAQTEGFVYAADSESEKEIDEDDWCNKFIYLGLSLLWIPRFYTAASQSNNIASLGIEFTTDVHITRFLSVRLGAELSQDMIVVKADEIITDRILDFPITVAYVLRPKQNIMLEPYLGVIYNLSLQNNTAPYPLSWNVGAELCIKTGIGIITVNTGVSRDIGVSLLPNGGPEYWRSTIHIGAGYKMGFLKRFF